MDDGVQYLSPVEERWGEIAVYPEHMNEYADRFLPRLREVWAADTPGHWIVGHMIALSCLLDVGRYDDLQEVLRLPGGRFWRGQRFGAEALARQGHVDAAVAYAERRRGIGVQDYEGWNIDRFCEEVLLRAGRADDAYRLYGRRTGQGSTYLAVFRDTVRRYPDRDRRQVLLDLIDARGEKGKWFAAARDAGFLDIALECARSGQTDPATLVRAARDLLAKDPAFSATVALLALAGLVQGGGYDPAPGLVGEAFRFLTEAASAINAMPWALTEATRLTAGTCSAGREPMQRTLAGLLETMPPVLAPAECGTACP
jgi:hypothetical protein